MRSVPLQRLDRAARQVTPFVLALVFLLLALIPFGIPELPQVMPAMAVIAVFYWSVYRPDLLPLWTVFLLGLTHDLLNGTGLGACVVALFTVTILVSANRRFFAQASFLAMWLAFSGIALLAEAVFWLGNAFVFGQGADPLPVAFRFLMTVACYPPFAALFGRIQTRLLR